MRRHAKAPSAGSTSGTGSSRGLFGRVLATRGASVDVNGSGAPAAAPRRLGALLGLVLLLSALTLALGVGAQASKVVYDSFCAGPAGTVGGQCNTPRGVAVNSTGTGGATAGAVYVVDSSNNRIQQFSAAGAFVRAFGRDVIVAGKPNDNATGFEICDTTAGNVAADCKAGITTPAEGGTLSTAQGIAINQVTGHLYVSNQDLLRIDEFDATGHFVRAFGQDVVSAGPGNAPAVAAQQTLTVDATAGQFKLSFRGQTSADLAFDATAAQVDAALEALSTVGAGNVAVSGGPGGAGGLTPYVVTFGGALNNAPMPSIGTAAGTTPLSGGAGAAVANTTTGATGYEVCSAPANTCKTGVSGATAGAFANTFSGRPAVVPAGPLNAGNVLVGDPGNQRVNEYTAAGAFVRSFGFDVVGSPPNSTTSFEICSAANLDVCKAAVAGSSPGQFATNQPNRVAVDASGTIYTLESGVNFRVQKFTPAGASLTPAIFNPPLSINPPFTLTGSSSENAPTEVAVTPSGGLFVVKACTAADCPGASLATERRVYEFNPAGTLIDTHLAGASFGATPTVILNGFGLNSTTGRLYLTTSELGADFIERFGITVLANPPANPPLATTGGSGSGPNPSLATLEGTVDPVGFKVTDCHFEYGPTAAYGHSVPCSPAAGQRQRQRQRRGQRHDGAARARHRLPLPPLRREPRCRRPGQRPHLHHRPRPGRRLSERRHPRPAGDRGHAAARLPGAGAGQPGEKGQPGRQNRWWRLGGDGPHLSGWRSGSLQLDRDHRQLPQSQCTRRGRGVLRRPGRRFGLGDRMHHSAREC